MDSRFRGNDETMVQTTLKNTGGRSRAVAGGPLGLTRKAGAWHKPRPMSAPKPTEPAQRWLQRLLLGDQARFLKFAVVGGSGVFVNLGILWFCTSVVLGGQASDTAVRVSEGVAILVSILTNFLLNNFWTWGDRREHMPFWSRLGKYYVAASVAAVLNYGLFELFWAGLSLPKLLANAAAIGFAMVLNYALQSRWTFRREHP